MTQIETVWALAYATAYIHIAGPVYRWWYRHRRDADYWSHLGRLVGLFVGILLSIWGTAQ